VLQLKHPLLNKPNTNTVDVFPKEEKEKGKIKT